MNEGVGSSSILVIIVVFIVFTFGYLAYNINYSKAFHMKNKVIRTYEKYNGVCKNTSSNPCLAEIQDYAKQIGYTAYKNLDCDSSVLRAKKTGGGEVVSGEPMGDLYCSYKLEASNGTGKGQLNDNGCYYYYRIMTRVNIQVPIIQRILSNSVLTVTGDTKQFKTDCK